MFPTLAYVMETKLFHQTNDIIYLCTVTKQLPGYHNTSPVIIFHRDKVCLQV